MKKTTKIILAKFLGILLLTLSLSSCVSLKGYREVKSQMLRGEIDNAMLQNEIEELNDKCSEKDRTISKKESEKATLQREIDNLKLENSRLKTDNDLLRKNR